MAEKEVSPPKVTVDSVEEPIHLAEETIEKIAGATKEPDSTRAGGRATDPAAAKAADDQTTVSTIETISTPHQQAEDALVSESQRAINLIWERTQQIVALSVIGVALLTSAWLSVSGGTDVQTASFVFLYGVANLVTGFYFGRSNHTKVGGVQQGR